MLVETLHREDIKATLRKRHGSVIAFGEKEGLTKSQLADWFRGRTSAPVANAIEAELQLAAQEDGSESIKLDDSGEHSDAHRLIAGAR